MMVRAGADPGPGPLLDNGAIVWTERHGTPFVPEL